MGDYTPQLERGIKHGQLRPLDFKSVNGRMSMYHGIRKLVQLFIHTQRYN